MRVFLSNLGCKLNQAEVDSMKRHFVAAGHRLAPSLAEADLHVVNSCTVTHLAARDSRKLARRAGRMDTGIRTVLTGCYATEQPEVAARLAGVHLVVPNADKERLVERVHQAFPDAIPAAGECQVPIPYVPLDFGLCRALVKVEDGCNMHCSFCIIPTTRGRQRSRPLEAVVAEVQALAHGGYQEVVVTGVQISAYRDGEHRLHSLVQALLERTDVTRLRLSSIAPWQFDPRLLALWQQAGPRLCRHVHLSLQSGCSATLRRMRRPVTAAAYGALVDRIRTAVASMAITTDVIVGFPGETDAEFDQSLRFVDAMGFARTHVFTFSPREGTHAATLPDAVPHAVKKERAAAMLVVARQHRAAFAQRCLGARAGVVWETVKQGRMHGLSDHYLRVYLEGDAGQVQVGRCDSVELLRCEADGVAARLVAGGCRQRQPA